jgi:hypothetical protein
MSSSLKRNVRVIESSDSATIGQKGKFCDYLSFPNIILLGDPGSGKTYAFETAAHLEKVDYFTVREFIAYFETLNIQKIIYLDGLDEFRSRLGDKNLIIELIQFLSKCNHPKLRLSCRSADWLGQSDLSMFKRYFHNTSFVVLHLEPLDDDEVFKILNEYEIQNANDFVARANELNLDSLLRNPQTLKMLAAVVRKSIWPKTRKELFEQSCYILLEESNREHIGCGQGKFSPDELIDTAGLVTSLLLISGVPGISLLEGAKIANEYPSYNTIDSQQKEKIQACLMRRCFSYADPEHEAVTYIHRTIAEYLGAKWLIKKVRAGHPLMRIESLIGIDCHPASELRGLHAWFPVFSNDYAKIFIQKDPYGILMYGDATSLSPALRKDLLSELILLSESDPWFRADDWSNKPLGALSGPDMVDSFRDILSNRDSSFHLRSLVLDAINNGPELPQMRDDLLQIIATDCPHRESVIAIEALLKVVPNGKKDVIDLFRTDLQNVPAKAPIRAKILSMIYEDGFKPEDIFSVCFDILHDTEEHALGELWNLAFQLPLSQLIDIIDKLCSLKTREDFKGERINQFIIESFFEKLLNRAFHSDFFLQPKRLWKWLTSLHALGNRYGANSDNDISLWLKQNKLLVFEMLLLVIEETEDSQLSKIWHDFQRITMNSLVGEELARNILERLEAKSALSEKDHFLYERCGSLIFWPEPDIARDLLTIFRSLTETHSSLIPICEKCCLCEIEDWQRDDNLRRLKRLQEEEDNRNKTQHNLEQTQTQVATGEHLHNIGILAEIYMGRYRGYERALPPIERLIKSIGEKFVDLALSGFAAVLEREDLPCPHDVAMSQAENKYYRWWYAVLAGVNETWLRNGKSFESLSNDQLKSALAIATALPTDSEGERDRLWQRQLLAERPDIAESVYAEIAWVELKSKKSHCSVLYSLVNDEETKSWSSQTALKLLRQFPCCQSQNLRLLIVAALYDPYCRDQLRDMAIYGAATCCNEEKALWIAVGFLLKPNVFSKLLNISDDLVWSLKYLIQCIKLKETEQTLQLTIQQIEHMILVAGSLFENVSMPKSGAFGVENPWDGSEFVHENINKIAVNPDREGAKALNRLLQEKALSSYHNHLRHSLAKQAVVRREMEYRQPSWIDSVQSLEGGKPANIADLHALVFDHLQMIKEKIQYNNTDPYKSFWRCDHNGKVEKPEIEDICRDRLIDLIKPSLALLNLHVDPEGHMAADKRTDIIILGNGGMRLPIELKRDFHNDLWTACANQLERMYTRDPYASGYGIYGVFWFGAKRTTGIRKPPDGIIAPQSAIDLENALLSLVPVEQQTTIKVIVFDVRPPYE